MSSSCQALLAALKDCLLHSDCVLKQGYLPSECLRDHTDELPDECKALRKATFECKRGMVSPKCLASFQTSLIIRLCTQLDMRKRFRGNNVGTQFTKKSDKDTPSPELE